MTDFNSQLLRLTEEQKQEAFEKAKKEANLTEGELVRICTNEDYKKAKKFMKTYFVPQEPLERGLGVPWNDEMLVDGDGEIMAIRTSFFAQDEKHDYDKDVKTESWRHVLKFCETGAAIFFDHFKTKECVQFFGLGTNDKYKNMGLATKLLNTAVLMVKNYGIRPIYIKGEGSNIYSKAVYEKSGFELLHELKFCDYLVDGKEIIVSHDANKSLRFYGKAIRD